MKKNTSKKILSFVLALVLAVSICFIPSVSVNTSAVTQNQKNMVDRADYYYGITWVAQETTGGWSGTFYKGETYRIPYGQPIYSGKYVGYGVSFEEFLKAASTAGSIFYTQRSWCDGTKAPYYASDCSSFVSWVWDIPRTTTYYIPNYSTNLGYVTTSRATSTLQLGDALNSNAHVVLVSGLDYDSAGNITRIEITEQTPPQMKRSYYTPSGLASKYGSYTIQRYYGDVPVAPGVKEETWVEKAAFDVMVYRDRNADLKDMTDAQLKEHWLKSGIKEGRASSTVLDLGFYLNNNPDLKEAYGTDYTKVYNHFITKGYKEGRKSSALFDGSYYCNKYPEVKESFKDDYMRHYVESGMKEGRRASLTFDPDYYWFIRPDVYNAWPDDYTMCARHYAGHGIVAQVEAYDNKHPVISNVKISDVSASGYTVTCEVTDNWGLSKVAFPTWTLLNNQDDLAADFMNTQKGTKNGNTYTFRVNASDHNNETGKYATHIYALDKGGNQTKLSLEVVDVKDPVVEPPVVEPVVEEIKLASSASYSADSTYVKKVKASTTVSSLLSQFDNDNLKVLDKNGNTLSNTSLVGTGATVNLYNGTKLVDSLTVIVAGDVDGNAVVDTTDYMRVKQTFLRSFTLNAVEVEAADVEDNDIVDSTDCMRIKSHFLGSYNLFA